MSLRIAEGKADRGIAVAIFASVGLSLVLGAALTIWHTDVNRWTANTIVKIGGPFDLIDQDGRAFTRADLLGHPHIVYFGFTYCPDLCPTMLFLLGSIVQGLGDKAAPLKVAFVTVDPERDTVQVMKDYVTAFDKDFIGLTGSPEAVGKAAKAYRISYEKVDLGGGNYTVDHSTSAMLFNADGSYADSIAFDESAAGARAKIASLIGAE